MQPVRISPFWDTFVPKPPQSFGVCENPVITAHCSNTKAEFLHAFFKEKLIPASGIAAPPGKKKFFEEAFNASHTLKATL